MSLIIVAILIACLLYVQIYRRKTHQERCLIRIQEELGNAGKVSANEITYMRLEKAVKLLKEDSDDLIDASTRNDLDLNRFFCEFCKIDSAIAQEYIYYHLSKQFCSSDELQEYDELTEFFLAQKEAAAHLSYRLQGIGKKGKNCFPEYLNQLAGTQPDSNFLQIFLLLLYIPVIVLIIMKPIPGIIALLMLAGIHIYRWFTFRSKQEYLISGIHYFAELIINARKIEQASILPVKQQNILSEYNKKLSDIYRKSRFILLCKGGNTVSFAGSDPIQLLLMNLNMFFGFDLIIYNRFLREVNSYSEIVLRLYREFGIYSLCISNASLRMRYEACVSKPTFIDNTHSFHINEGIHPLLKNPIPNSIECDGRVLITGSNASGKSTFLRMIGLNVHLAQTLYTVLAKSYAAPICRIYTSIGLSDNLSEGKSYFVAEAERLYTIYKEADNHRYPVLCIVDEVLRGTNTAERIGASAAIMREIGNLNAICFAATHDYELTELLGNCYLNVSFSETVTEDNVSFDYRLNIGTNRLTNAITMLARAGFPDYVITESKKTASNIMTSREV